MTYNLLQEAWLPVIREDGSRDRIAPWQIAEGPNRAVDIAPPRADLRAGLLEFLVGLMQTALPVDQVGDWKQRLASPPGPDEIKAGLAAHEPFFHLFGQRPRFMQDLTMTDADKPARNGVAALLIDSPGGNTLKQNCDFFVKRGRVESLCPACAAAALYILQAFAPSGGKGHRTSLRGGGPLSTLVAGDTLWEKVWRNVIPFSGGATAPPTGEALKGAVYPWAAPTRSSEKGEETHPEDVHPLHAYWAMPRRIVLEESASDTTCDLCGEACEIAVTSYQTRPSGYNYGPTWRHPLTPYRLQSGEPPLSVKGQANLSAYSNWLGVVHGQPEAQSGKKRSVTVPAACVGFTLGRVPGTGVNAAGYDMDNMKAVQWCEHTFPVYAVKRDLDEYRELVQTMVLAADQIRRNLTGMLKDALVNEAGKNQAKIDATLFANASTRFWAETETVFYACAAQLAEAEDDAGQDTLLHEWGKTLLNAAARLFDEHAMAGRIPPERMERHVQARRKLRNYNRKYLMNNGLMPEGGE